MSRSLPAGKTRAGARVQTLDNGVRIVAESVPSVRSCGIGVWVDAGSAMEGDDERGITHFIEHMLFKGTGARDVQKLADAMNWLGGNVNAFTGQETLCLHAKTIDRKAHEALDLLGEMLTDSVFPAAEIGRERRVVLEEVGMIEDTPDEYSVDLFMRNVWPGHPLGEPVIGKRATIRAFNREGIADYWQRCLDPSRLVVSIAGAFDSKACEHAVVRHFSKLRPVPRKLRASKRPPARGVGLQSALNRTVEQAHFCFGCPAPDRRSPDRFALSLMNLVLGGGMSSRLFVEVREKRGLAYSIGSFTQAFMDAGVFAVSGGTNPKTLGQVLAICLAETGRISEEPVGERELDLARAQALDAIVMGLENMETRMMRLADGLLTHGRVIPVDETMQKVSDVTTADVLRIARRHLRRRPLAAGVVGPRGSGRQLQRAMEEGAK